MPLLFPKETTHETPQPVDRVASWLVTGEPTPPGTGLFQKSPLFSDLATLHQESARSLLLAKSSVGTPLLLITNSILRVSSLTTPALDKSSALRPLKYAPISHNHILTNKVDDSPGTNIFLMAHRTTPGCAGHFWFLQVGTNYLDDHNSKTTMLLGLSSFMDILPNAINGFELHPLDEQSSLPHLTNNKIEDGFPGSAVLAFKYVLVRDN
jgi:hypothetical protein